MIIYTIIIGQKFWKGNKKIKAVSEEDLALYNEKHLSNIQCSSKAFKQLPVVISSSDDDATFTTSKASSQKEIKERR